MQHLLSLRLTYHTKATQALFLSSLCSHLTQHRDLTPPERIYNPITAMGFSAMFNFQLDNTKR